MSFSSISSFICLHVLPLCFSSFSSHTAPSRLSFSYNSGWKGHCWILFPSCMEGKWNGNVSHFSFGLSLSSSSFSRRPPNQAWDFPRPLYNCCTNQPIVQLFFCMFLHSLRLCVFIRNVGDTKKDPASCRLPTLLPHLLFSPLSWPYLVPCV